jgi:protein pelota
VSEEHIKEYEQFMEQAEQLKGKIMIISTEHEAGERFLSIGGIAAFLRFKLR